jgi:hypothetical protein
LDTILRLKLVSSTPPEGTRQRRVRAVHYRSLSIAMLTSFYIVRPGGDTCVTETVHQPEQHVTNLGICPHTPLPAAVREILAMPHRSITFDEGQLTV